MRKHGVTPIEVEHILLSRPYVRKAKKGRIKGEDVYVAYGQTHLGRYLLFFFVKKHRCAVMPISARDMNPKQRRFYHAQKKTS